MKNNYMNKKNLLTLRNEIATLLSVARNDKTYEIAIRQKACRTGNDPLRLFRQISINYFSERYLLIINSLFFPLSFPCFAYY